MNRSLVTTPAFSRAARKYLKKHPQQAQAIETCLRLLELDAFDSRLKTHKLQGNLNGVWACSAGFDLRILFEFVTHEDQEAILLLTVGSHDEVY